MNRMQGWMLVLMVGLIGPAVAQEPTANRDQVAEYRQEEIVAAANDFFGSSAESLASVIERIFREQGRPSGYIAGTEAGGAVGVGVRYGKGVLHLKSGGRREVFWQGPSIGWDFGGDASKVFTLVYNLHNVDVLFKRYPAVDGSLFVVGGVGANYQRLDGVTLAPIRSGVGLRAGAAIGYVHYTPERRMIPF